MTKLDENVQSIGGKFRVCELKTSWEDVYQTIREAEAHPDIALKTLGVSSLDEAFLALAEDGGRPSWPWQIDEKPSPWTIYFHCLQLHCIRLARQSEIFRLAAECDADAGELFKVADYLVEVRCRITNPKKRGRKPKSMEKIRDEMLRTADALKRTGSFKDATKQARVDEGDFRKLRRQHPGEWFKIAHEVGIPDIPKNYLAYLDGLRRRKKRSSKGSPAGSNPK